MEDTDRFYEAVAEGVARGIFRIAANASDMPTEDFFEFLKRGVREGVADAIRERGD